MASKDGQSQNRNPVGQLLQTFRSSASTTRSSSESLEEEQQQPARPAQPSTPAMTEDLKVFRPFQALSAKTDIKAKPTCVATWDEYVIVGCTNGNLLSFRIVDERKMTLALHKQKKLSKAIKQMEVLNHPQMHMLLVLSNGSVTAHFPDSLVQQPDKGAITAISTYFAVDPKPPFSIACQKTRRRLTIYCYSKASGKWEQDAELAVPDWVLGTEWIGKSREPGGRRERLCLAYKTEYSIVDIDSGQITKVPLSLDSSGPCLKATQDHELLLATNNLGLFINDQGTLEAKSTISWTASPVEIRLCAHYIMAAMPDGSIEISSLLDQEEAHVQTIPTIPGDNAVLSMHADSNRCVVLSKDGVQVLQLSFLLEQVATYLQHARVQQAENLLLRTNPSPKQLGDFHAEAGWVLFKELRFQDALDHFAKSSVDPRDVIYCFPDLRMEEFPYSPKHPQAPQQDISALVTEGKRLAKRKATASYTHREIMERSKADLCKQAKFWLSDYLWKFCLCHGRAKSNNVGAPASSFSSRGGDREAALRGLADPAVQSAVDTALLMLNVMHGEMDESDIAHDPTARSGVVVHGASSSSSQLAENNELYPFCLEELLLPKNNCHLTVCEFFLISRRRYDTLALLYLSHQLVKKALEVWKQLGSGQFKERACRMHPDSPAYTASSSSSFPTLEPPSPAQMSAAAKHPGLFRTVGLLAQLAACPMLWEYAPWCLQAQPQVGIQIFTGPAQSSSAVPSSVPEGGLGSRSAPLRLQPLDPARVLGFLKEQPRVGAFDLVQLYLEHLAPTTPKYHQQLALLYLRKVVSLQLPPTARPKLPVAAAQPAPSSVAGSSSSSSLPRGASSTVPGQEPGLLGQARKKLLAFLNQSNHYEPRLLLKLAEENELWQELAVLYQKLGMHRHVLQVFVFQLRDTKGAAEYCKRTWLRMQAPSLEHHVAKGLAESAALDPSLVSLSSAPALQVARPDPSPPEGKLESEPPPELANRARQEGSAVFETLVEIYCSPAYQQAWKSWQDPTQRDISSSSSYSDLEEDKERAKEKDLGFRPVDGCDYQQQVVALLTHYHAYTNPVRVLKKLPPDFPLFALRPYLSAVIPRTIHARRTSQVVKNLCRQDHLEAKSMWIDHRSASFLIQDSGPVCAYCRKSIGVAAFRTMPVPKIQGGPDISSDCRYPNDVVTANPDLTATAHKVVHYRCAEDYNKMITARLAMAAPSEQSDSVPESNSEDWRTKALCLKKLGVVVCAVAMTILAVPDLPATASVSAPNDTSLPADVDTRRPASVDDFSWLDKDQEQSVGWDKSMLLDCVQYLRVTFRNQVTGKLRKVYEPLEAVLAWNEHDPVEHAQWVRTINEEVVAQRCSWKCLGDCSALPAAALTPGLAGVAAVASKVQQRFKHLQRHECAAFALFNVLDAPRQYNKKMRKFGKSIKSLAVFFEFVYWLQNPDLTVCRQPAVARSLNRLLEPTQGLALVIRGTHCFGVDFGRRLFFDCRSDYTHVLCEKSLLHHGFKQGSPFEIISVSHLVFKKPV
eukprot:g47898.t1